MLAHGSASGTGGEIKRQSGATKWSRVDVPKYDLLLTYCPVASQFIVWDASAAFSILAESFLHCSLSLASSVILTRSSVDWGLKWSSSPRSLFSTIGRVVVGRPLSLWPYWMKQALLVGMSLSLRRIWPKRFQRDFRICSERGFSWHFLYSGLFVIFTGKLMFRTFFSCFRWKAFIFSSSVRVSAHVLQFYSSMDFTRDL